MKLSSLVLVSALLACLVPAAVAARNEPARQRAADQEEQNKRVARRVYDDVLGAGRFEVSDGLYTADFVGHGGTSTFTHAQGLAEAKGFRAAFPDLVMRVDLMLADRDLVAVRWTAQGTNTGNGNGLPATGKRVQVSGTTVFRFVEGKIAEEWTSGDALGLFRQLGLIPAPASGAPRSEVK